MVPAFTEPRFLVLRPGLSALVGRCSEDENPWEMDENEEAIANVHVPPDTVKPVANTGVPSAKRQTISIEVPGKDYRDQADNHRPRKSSKLSRKDVHGRSM